MSAADVYRALLLAAQDSDPEIAERARYELRRIRKRGAK